MLYHISPLHQLVFQQICWIERRRKRIENAVALHFGKSQVRTLLQEMNPPVILEVEGKEIEDLLTDLDPEQFLKTLAYQVEFEEARTVDHLCRNASAYPHHVQEQVLFGARQAGQEAARHQIESNPSGSDYGSFSLAEVFSALSQLNYSGLPQERNHFVSIRPLSDISIHVRNCPHVQAWRDANADPSFLCEVQAHWIRGFLDILAPGVKHMRPTSIAKGHPFGKDQFILREKTTAF